MSEFPSSPFLSIHYQVCASSTQLAWNEPLAQKPYRHFLLNIRPFQNFTEFFKRYHPVTVLVRFDDRSFHYARQLFFAVESKY